MSGLVELPACDARADPAPSADATPEVHAYAAIDGVRIVDHGESMHVYPPIPAVIYAAAEAIGAGCRAVGLANWVQGSEVHRWWRIEIIDSAKSLH